MDDIQKVLIEDGCEFDIYQKEWVPDDNGFNIKYPIYYAIDNFGKVRIFVYPFPNVFNENTKYKTIIKAKTILRKLKIQNLNGEHSN